MTAIGFVGLGLIGARRLRIVRELGHQIAFAIDPDIATHQALATEGCVFACSIAECGAVAKADIIFIAVPHDLARDTCLWALAQGAHVLCEKPMGLTSAQAREIEAAVKKAGVRFGAGFNYRYLPAVRMLQWMAAEKRFGEVFSARFHVGHGGRPGMEKEWKVKKARAGGGALIDPGIHLLDLARFLFGELTAEHAQLRRRFWQTDVEDNCELMLRAGSADVGVAVSLTSWKNRFGIEIQGSDGMALASGRGGNYGAQSLEYVNRWFWQQGQDQSFVKDFGARDDSFADETQAFLRWCLEGVHDGVLSTEKDGVAALALVDSLYAGDRVFGGDRS
jgi:predicted dehydrogenase